MDKDIIYIVKKIARNLENYDRVISIVTDKKNIRICQGMSYPAWDSVTLSHGIPGICLLYGKLMECFPDEEIWAVLAHQYLGHLVKELNAIGFRSLSMFSGASGVGLAVASISNSYQNYNKLLRTINNYIITQFGDVYATGFEGVGTYSSYYDVIEGLSGILSYCSLYYHHDNFYKILLSGLEKLVVLTKDIIINEVKVPGWYIPSENQFSETERKLYPNGNFNTSFSHGIAGPLALLADMKCRGIVVKGQEEAIEKIVGFLLDYKLYDGKRYFWKGQIDYCEYTNNMISKDNAVRRDAWCYGNPGICYAILLAGKAMKKTDWIDYALDNIKKTMMDIRGVFSPTFCHGFSGLYQLLNSAECVMGNEIYLNEKQYLKGKIMSYYDSDYLFGFRNIEIGDDEGNIKPYEYVGLLDGTVGVCLTLLEDQYQSDAFWKKAFLLA